MCKLCRLMIGVSNPADCAPGQIRSDFAVFPGRKIIGGSDNSENAKREIKLWFKEEEILKWNPVTIEWTHGVN